MGTDDFPHPPLDDERVMRTLDQHGVKYVLIGGLAAEAHGSQRVTFDIDIVPRADDENLGRLARALETLDGKVIHTVLRDEDSWEIHIERPSWSPQVFLENPFLHVRTQAGDVDVLIAPDGLPAGYDQLIANTILIRPRGIAVRLASVDDLIATKKASGRPKDLEAAAELEALRDSPPI